MPTIVNGVPRHLLSDLPCECSTWVCLGDHIGAVKPNPLSHPIRWFITMGHPGFNSRANNGNGYASRKLAQRAMKRWGSKRKETR